MEARKCENCGSPLKPAQKRYCQKECYWDAMYDVPRKTGMSIDTKGYPRYEFGPKRGRRVHIVVMEEKLGRPLEPHEIVDHIDHNKLNYDPKNLRLKDKVQHSKDHGQEYAPLRKRNKNGTFALESEMLLPRLKALQEKPRAVQQKVDKPKPPPKPKVVEPKPQEKPQAINGRVQNLLEEFGAGAGWR